MAVVSLDITQRSPFAGGESFGGIGPYELLEGTESFTVNPLSPGNQVITDIELAPRDPEGRVRHVAAC